MTAPLVDLRGRALQITAFHRVVVYPTHDHGSRCKVGLRSTIRSVEWS